MQNYSNNIADQAGNAVAYAQISIFNLDGTLATLFSNSTGTASLPNPFTADAYGRFTLFAANGTYKGTAAGNGILGVPFQFRLFDPTDANAAAGVVYGTDTVGGALDSLQLADYTALRAYAGPRKSVYVTGYLGTAAPSGIAGMFVRDDHDTTTPDDGWSCIVTAADVRFKRVQGMPFASDGPMVSTQPCYAVVSVNGTRTAINRHAFEDWTQLNTTDTNLGYCSFDAQATLNNPNVQQHFVGYQSRNIITGAGGLSNYWHGYDTNMQHNGSGTVAFAAGMRIRDISGSGPIAQNYGLWFDTSATRGTDKNWAIYVAGTAPNYMGTRTSFAITTGSYSLDWFMGDPNNSAKRRFGIVFANSETGSNAGSDFWLNAYDDTGSYVATALSVKRSTGNVRIKTTTDDGVNALQVGGPIRFRPAASSTPANPGDVTFEFTNDTTLKIKAKGSDGVVRSTTLTLA